MKRPSLGEFELIARLAARLPVPEGSGIIGIGDDAAAIPCGEELLLLTCDIAVAGRHFLPGLTPMADVGWKVTTSNVSDIVACGGRPGAALISLGVPAQATEADFDELYRGIAEAAAHYGFQVLGGNVSGATELVVDCFMVGRTPRFIPRGGARPGELIALSGAVGESDAGLAVLQAGEEGAEAQGLLRRHLRPVARTDLVDSLQETASAAIDISDSLASELNHLAEASGARMEVDGASIPVSPRLAAFSEKRGEDPLQRVLFGGEEYELVFTLPPDRAGRLEGSGVKLIGEVTEGSGVFLSGRPLPAKGWDHLRDRG
jgi:thiamine-monophosphate kinase